MDWQSATETLLRPLLQAARFGLLSDLDGTLSPIVPVPDDAQVTPANRHRLSQLAGLLPLVAIISGRSASDIHQRVGLEPLVYVGNHGMERWDGSKPVVHPEVVPFRAALERVIDEIQPYLMPGMTVDDKGASLTIHYRQAAAFDTEGFRSQLQRLAAEYRLALFEGRKVFELRPPVSINKGSILEQLVDEYRLDAALFIGDDTTDVDALQKVQSLRQTGRCYAVGIGVETAETPAAVLTAADLRVQGIEGVEALLGWLYQSLSASSS
jgi:trehalose 6-phosphate phosphatase